MASDSGRRAMPERSAKTLSAAAARMKLSSSKLKLLEELGEERLEEFLQQERNRKKQESKEERPSDLSRHRAARQVQFGLGGPQFICYRGPPQARPRVPLSLVDKSFFDFRLNAAATSQVEEMDISAAHDLWCMSSRGWDDEVKNMTPDVNRLFTKYLGRPVQSSGIDGKNTDGQLWNTMILFEHKIQPADGYFQGLDYLRRLFLWSAQQCCYGLLILVACPHIQAVAVVMDWEQEKVVAEPLTGLVNCFGAEEFDLPVLAATLRAIRVFCTEYQMDRAVRPAVPYMFKDRHIEQLEGKLVFLLEPAKVAKLTRSYSEEAHQHWAAVNSAPPLHSVKDLGGGWKLVELAYLGIQDGWQQAKQVVSDHAHDPEVIARLSQSIRDAAVRGHATGYVHGDLRLPNIRVRPRDDSSFDVMFFDFDWAGKIGEATYPTVLNPDHPWHPDAGYKKSIKQEHDLQFADNLLGQLELVESDPN